MRLLIRDLIAGRRVHLAAGRAGDGLINVAPDREVVETFEASGGEGKPRFGMIHVCWHEDEREARRFAHRLWPNLALEGDLSREIKTPADFDDAIAPITEDQVAEQVPCGPDPEPYLELVRKFADAGFDHVYAHQIGEDQEGFLRFAAEELRLQLERLPVRSS